LRWRHPESFASESRALGRAQGQIEDILAEGEDCLRQGRLEQATGHAARAAAEMERAQEDLARNDSRKGSPLKFLSSVWDVSSATRPLRETLASATGSSKRSGDGSAASRGVCSSKFHRQI
jgi:hypothetical protein